MQWTASTSETCCFIKAQNSGYLPTSDGATSAAQELTFAK